MNHAVVSRYELSTTTDEERELVRCRREIARLKQLVVQLSELVLRNVTQKCRGPKVAIRLTRSAVYRMVNAQMMDV
ncbi:hypothetical protein [Bradyrhizobium pachyrhizi]|nr:hypothetical protein [Bradyrhizobium pachyrhizi]